jgi:benzoyl-CoA reductase subunit B
LIEGMPMDERVSAAGEPAERSERRRGERATPPGSPRGNAARSGTDAQAVGRGVAQGAELFRQWFAELDAAAERHQGAAYVFVMGSLTELLRTFDFPIVFPEINSLQTAVRRVAHEYLDRAEDYGYSPDVCAYVKADVGLQLQGGVHPMGRLPKPALAIATNACNTYIKWAEIWERLHGTPVVTIDVPGTRYAGGQTWPGNPDFERDRVYVASQIRELIPICERLSGRRFDIDRLRESMGYANEMSRSFRQVVELNRARPAPFNAVTDGTVYLGVANGLRGTVQGRDYFNDLVEELGARVVMGQGTAHEERFRLAFLGVPCYPLFRRFNEMFAEWGGVFVASTYLAFASGGAALAWEYDLSRPIDALAEGLLISVRHAMDNMFFADQAIAQAAGAYALDGAVFHAVKSCRTVSTGLADARRAISASRDLPGLLLESDMMDRRVVSEAQLKNRIDAFFEGLRARAAGRGTASEVR